MAKEKEGSDISITPANNQGNNKPYNLPSGLNIVELECLLNLEPFVQWHREQARKIDTKILDRLCEENYDVILI